MSDIKKTANKVRSKLKSESLRARGLGMWLRWYSPAYVKPPESDPQNPTRGCGDSPVISKHRDGRIKSSRTV